MDFDFPEELKQLRETANAFLAERCPPAIPRRVLENGETHDPALWKQMAEMGWTGAAIPESHGGVGLGRLAVCVLAEEIGRALAPVPFSSSVYLATEALLLYGGEAQKDRWLPRLADGSAIGTFALAERNGPLLRQRLQSTAVGGRLTGVKAAVPDAAIADFAIVAVHAVAGEPALHLVERTAPGVVVEPVTTLDPSRGHARLRFEAAPAEPLPAALGPAAVAAVVDRAACMMAFEQLGGAEAALEMARRYAHSRFAFGRPIGSFQAIKHKLVDVYVACTLARSNACYGAWALDTEAEELPVAAATARIAACDAGWLATKENIQTHGGMGYTWELDCHLYYRRAKLLGLALGSGREWKRLLIERLRGRETAPAAA